MSVEAEQLRDDIRALQRLINRVRGNGGGGRLLEAYEHVLHRRCERLERLEFDAKHKSRGLAPTRP